MSSLLELCPTAPTWTLNWVGLEEAIPELKLLFECPQDSIHHAEGDVGIHTRMVCEELIALSEWRELPKDDRCVVFLGALLHDIAKPACTREEDGRLTSRGHSRRGEIQTRELLWRGGVPIRLRERTCALVRRHMLPFFLLDQDDPERRLRGLSLRTRCSDLGLVAEADMRGRVCADQARRLEGVDLFREFAREQGCLSEPYAFPSPHTRFMYFRDPTRVAECEAYDDTRSEVVVMSGFPGAGKSHWIAEHLSEWPVVSLDGLRVELKVKPRDNQGAVVNLARERAREFLRRGERFVWNATNLSKDVRSRCLRLLADYKAKIRIVYVEASPKVLTRQNRDRPHPVPEPVLKKLRARWEVPDLTEAHDVEWIANDAG